MTSAETENTVDARAKFDFVRYAQVWEDADVLLEGLRVRPGDHVVSVASAGDNVLALLTADPGKISAFDISRPQLECLQLKTTAFQELDHRGLLELIGARPSDRREELFATVLRASPIANTEYWDRSRELIVEHGLGGIGKFERYLRLFSRRVLPLTLGRRRVTDLLEKKNDDEREKFYERRWNTWRWRILVSIFFSRRMMARLGRDPAFFDHVDGSVSEHIARRTRHALVEQDPSENPYLHWILQRHYGEELPLYLRHKHFETIRSRLDRIEISQAPIGSIDWDLKADAYNLSDIFEYMSDDEFAATLRRLSETASPGARFLYWNMMVRRGVPESLSGKLRRNSTLERQLYKKDKAFFYSDLVVAEQVGQ